METLGEGSVVVNPRGGGGDSCRLGGNGQADVRGSVGEETLGGGRSSYTAQGGGAGVVVAREQSTRSTVSTECDAREEQTTTMLPVRRRH